MKSKLMRNALVSPALAVAGLLLGAAAGQAAPPSPAGVTWDCTVNGAQGRGVAYITFSETSFTFSGAELITTNRKTVQPTTPSVDPRGGTTVGRDGTSGTTNTVTTGTSSTTTNLFGYGAIQGPWTYDLDTGRVIGFFTQRIAGDDGTNYTVNSVGFKAKVVPGKRLTLVASTPNGQVTYTGKPVSTNVPSLSGSWYAYKKRGTLSLVEFFNLTPTGSPGEYTVFGEGAGYTIEGTTLVSGWNRIGFNFRTTAEGSGDKIHRAVVGPFYPRRLKAETTGVEDPGGNCSFNARWYQAPLGF